MTMFKRILVPLDGTPQSSAALPAARTVARVTGAAISLMQAVPSGEAVDSLADSRAELDRIAAELRAGGLAVDVVIRAGEPAEEIVREVEAAGADLIVMRTHGRSGIGRAILGSVAQQVLAQSPVPVLTVRPGGRRLTHLRNLLVPVDGSPGGAVALGTAVGLAQTTGAALRLIEVVVPIPTYMTADFGLGSAVYIDPAWDDEALASAQTYVNGIAGRLRTAGVSVEGEVHFGPLVAGGIVKQAESSGSDLIVMSTQALTGPARALLGSVADEVVRNAHCPVLLVRRSAQWNGAPAHNGELVTRA